MTPHNRAGVTAARALAAFVCGTLFYSLGFVQRVAPSVMTGELMRDFSVGAAALGTLAAWYFYTYAAVQIPVGMLNDRFGPRKLLSIAALTCALASVGFALSESALSASVFRAIIGGAVAFGFIGTLTIAHDWFAPARFAMLAGAIQTVGMCGAVIGQAPLRYVVEAVGWRATIGGMGAVAVVLAVALFYIIPQRPQSDEPQHSGSGMFAGVAAVASGAQSWLCGGSAFGITTIMLAFAGLWAVPWLHQVYGYSLAAAAGVASLLFVGWAVGAPLSGWLSDHIGRRKPFLVAGSLCSLLLFAVALFTGISAPAVLSVLFFLLGICGATTVTVGFGVMREINAPQNSATAMGAYNMFIVGSGAVLQPVIGWLLDINWDGTLVDGARVYTAATYRTAFSVLLGTNLMAAVCALLLRETYCRQLSAR